MIDLRDFEYHQVSRFRACAADMTMQFYWIMRSTFSMANDLNTWHEFSPCSPYSPNSNRFLSCYLKDFGRRTAVIAVSNLCFFYVLPIEIFLRPKKTTTAPNMGQDYYCFYFAFIINHFRFIIAFSIRYYLSAFAAFRRYESNFTGNEIIFLKRHLVELVLTKTKTTRFKSHYPCSKWSIWGMFLII